jgi:hypothetical protein
VRDPNPPAGAVGDGTAAYFASVSKYGSSYSR